MILQVLLIARQENEGGMTAARARVALKSIGLEFREVSAGTTEGFDLLQKSGKSEKDVPTLMVMEGFSVAWSAGLTLDTANQAVSDAGVEYLRLKEKHAPKERAEGDDSERMSLR